MQKIENCYDQCVACTIWPIIFSGNVSSTQGLPLGFSNFSQPYWTNLINCDYTLHLPTQPTHNPRLASLKIEVSSKFLCPCTGKISWGYLLFDKMLFKRWSQRPRIKTQNVLIWFFNLEGCTRNFLVKAFQERQHSMAAQLQREQKCG